MCRFSPQSLLLLRQSETAVVVVTLPCVLVTSLRNTHAIISLTNYNERLLFYLKKLASRTGAFVPVILLVVMRHRWAGRWNCTNVLCWFMTYEIMSA